MYLFRKSPVLFLLLGCLSESKATLACDGCPLFAAIKLVKLSIPLKVTDYFSSGLQDENLLVGPEAVRSRCAEDMGFAV